MKAEIILDKGRALLKSKGDDYTEDRDKNQFQNFERASYIVSWFKDDQDKVFATMIATKLARLAALLSTDNTPNNESLEDTFIDGANYFALWGGKRVRDMQGEAEATRIKEANRMMSQDTRRAQRDENA